MFLGFFFNSAHLTVLNGMGNCDFFPSNVVKANRVQQMVMASNCRTSAFCTSVDWGH